MFPTSKYAPPISTICFTLSIMSGALWNALAIFVKGPRGHKVIDLGSFSRRVSIIKSTACFDLFFEIGSFSSGPSNPVAPCTYSAVTNGRKSGASQPAKTPISCRSANSVTIRAFFVVKLNGTFPATVVIPRISSSGLDRARRIATASSWPGSVSMIIFFAILKEETNQVKISSLKRVRSTIFGN